MAYPPQPALQPLRQGQPATRSRSAGISTSSTSRSSIATTEPHHSRSRCSQDTSSTGIHFPPSVCALACRGSPRLRELAAAGGVGETVRWRTRRSAQRAELGGRARTHATHRRRQGRQPSVPSRYPHRPTTLRRDRLPMAKGSISATHRSDASVVMRAVMSACRPRADGGSCGRSSKRTHVIRG